MTVLDVEDPAVDESPEPSRSNGRLRTVLIAVIAVAVAVIVAAAGWFARGADDPAAPAGPSAVDVGFAQDMSTHHTQAVTMAGIERDGTTDSKLRVLAFDIETGQQFQVGQMQGWLDGWGKPRVNDDVMAWMGHQHMAMGPNGLMPGMATPAQMDKLVTLRGKALDIMFLQLMIHHHQGGIPMANYAADHATSSYVRTVASAMASTQSSEIIAMEQELRQLGGTPLPPPS